MTGFGKATLHYQPKKITVVKSLNSKGLDLNVRMPSLYRKWNWVYNQIALKLERGKVDFSILSKVRGTNFYESECAIVAYIKQLREVMLMLMKLN
jgi:uncharacterized protein YicC (UPF0701 family)